MAWMAGSIPRLGRCPVVDCFAKALVCDVIRPFEIVEQEVSFEQVIRTSYWNKSFEQLFDPKGLQTSGHSLANHPRPGSQAKKKDPTNGEPWVGVRSWQSR